LTFLHQVGAIVAKDVAAEIRTRELASAMLVFAVLSLLIFSFALDLSGDLARVAAPGVLWTTLTFAGLLELNRSFVHEQQDGCIDGLLLAPMDRSAILCGKALGNLIVMVTVESILLPLASVLFGANLVHGAVLLVTFLGTLGYAIVGTLLAAVAVNTRAREVMLPVLTLPLTVPLLIAVVQATAGLLEGAPLSDVQGWVSLVVAYDLTMTAVAILTFGFVVGE